MTICRLHSRRRNRNPSRCGHDPQGGARPAVGNQRSMAADNAAAWPHDAEIPLTDVRSVPKTGLARPPPTQQTARKGRLNFLYAECRRVEKSWHEKARLDAEDDDAPTRAAAVRRLRHCGRINSSAVNAERSSRTWRRSSSVATLSSFESSATACDTAGGVGAVFGLAFASSAGVGTIT